MSVRRRTWRAPDGTRREAYMIDVQVQLPTGEIRRVREVAPVQGRRAAERHEQQVRARLLAGLAEPRSPVVVEESEVHDEQPQPHEHPRSRREPAPLSSGTATPKPRRARTPRTPTRPPCPTLADFAPRFVEHHRAKGNKPGELRAKEQVLAQHLIPAFGACRLDRLTARMIDAYKVDKQRPASEPPSGALAEALSQAGQGSGPRTPKRLRPDRPRRTRRGLDGLRPHTINNHLTILRSLLRLAARWELIDRVPLFEMVREDVRDPEFLSFDEARRLVAAAEPGWRTFLILAIGSGLRTSELRALRWIDVDLERGRIRVSRNLTPTGFDTPKSRRPRSVKLGGDVLAALRAHPRHPGSELVLCREDGSPLSMAQIRGAVERATKAAKIGRPIRPGILRHTFATHGVMDGVPLNVVQSWMGHSDVRVTMRYAHMAPDIEGDLVDRLAARRQLGAECAGMGRGRAHGTTTAHERHMELSDKKTGS